MLNCTTISWTVSSQPRHYTDCAGPYSYVTMYFINIKFMFYSEDAVHLVVVIVNTLLISTTVLSFVQFSWFVSGVFCAVANEICSNKQSSVSFNFCLCIYRHSSIHFALGCICVYSGIWQIGKKMACIKFPRCGCLHGQKWNFSTRLTLKAGRMVNTQCKENYLNVGLWTNMLSASYIQLFVRIGFRHRKKLVKKTAVV